MFRAYQNKGFQISFVNGLTFSVMFGQGNYCQHRFEQSIDLPDGSTNAEIAVFQTDVTRITASQPSSGYIFADGFNGTGHCGWLSPEQVAKCMAYVAEHPKDRPYDDLIGLLKSATMPTPA